MCRFVWTTLDHFQLALDVRVLFLRAVGLVCPSVLAETLTTVALKFLFPFVDVIPACTPCFLTPDSAYSALVLFVGSPLAPCLPACFCAVLEFVVFLHRPAIVSGSLVNDANGFFDLRLSFAACVSEHYCSVRSV